MGALHCGKHRKQSLPHLFSAAVSFTVRTTALLGVVLLAAFDYPETFYQRATILFCQPNETLQMLKLYPICQGTVCLSFVSEPRLTAEQWSGGAAYSVPPTVHKYRICSEKYTLVFLGAAVLTVSTIISILASLRLHHLSTYLNLHKVSRGCLPNCIP